MQHNLAGYRKRTLNLFFYEMKCQPNLKKKKKKKDWCKVQKNIHLGFRGTTQSAHSFAKNEERIDPFYFIF